MTRRGLEANRRRGRRLRRQPAHEQLHARLATFIAKPFDLSKQHSRRNALRQRGLHPIDNVTLERIELLGPFWPRLTLGYLIATAHIPPNCVARPSCQP